MNVCRQTNGRLGETGIYTFRLRADRGGRASFVRDAPGELPRTPLAVVSELAPTYAPDRTRVIPGVTETRRLWRPPDRSQDPEGSLVRTTVMDPNDPTIDGVRNRPAKRCACGRALLAGFGGPAEPVQDLDRTTAGIQDTGVELGLGPEPVSVDRSIGDGRRRGGADQDDADGKGEGSHERTISGSDVRRNRRTGSGSASAPSHPEGAQVLFGAIVMVSGPVGGTRSLAGTCISRDPSASDPITGLWLRDRCRAC